MRKILYICLTAIVLLAISNNTFTQNLYYSGKVRIIVNDAAIIPTEGEPSSNASFNQILTTFNITEITQPMSFASTPELQRLYELNTSQNEDLLFTALTELNNTSNLFLSVEKCPIPQNLYNPADHMWSLYLNDPTNDWLWYLDIIQAPEAWDITKGSSTVKVAIVDDGIDPNHPDLIGKISPLYDFYTASPFGVDDHGTSVATLLAAETVDAGQTANGQMASIGYNTKVMFASFGYGLEASVYASTVLGADILSISWYSPWLCNNPSTQALLAEQEILNNGTTIIRAAGNGPTNCGGQRLYPFSGYEDPRTIVVSSTGKDDKHVNSEQCSGYGTNSHYPQVDLCAPGYRILAGV